MSHPLHRVDSASAGRFAGSAGIRGQKKGGRRAIGGKTKATASSERLERRIGERLRPLGIGTAKVVRHLGVDYAPSRRTKRAVCDKRWEKARRRLGKVKSLGLNVGKKTVSTGIMLAVTYGAAVHGVRSHHIRTAQQLAAAVSGLKKGRSVTARLLSTRTDPSHLLAIPPIFEWAEPVWEQDVDKDILDAARTTAPAVVVRAAEPAAAVVGPASAFLVSLFRIGWRAPSYRHVLTRHGHIIDLLDECPRIESPPMIHGPPKVLR